MVNPLNNLDTQNWLPALPVPIPIPGVLSSSNPIFSATNPIQSPLDIGASLSGQPLQANCADPYGVNEIKALVSQYFKPPNYTPAQIKEMNSKGVYTSASEMSPDLIKNITKGKVKDISAGTYGGVKLNQDQVNNARIIAATIVNVGKNKNKSPQEIHKAVVVALSTAMQESQLKNIAHGMDGIMQGFSSSVLTGEARKIVLTLYIPQLNLQKNCLIQII